ncbi:MAG TPA: hypothetical protein VG891_04115 [Rhizomicrobium sp.]|nr:hypothetical protein [Rhizomicrobium sp.]
MQINPLKTGVAVGVIVGGGHLFWATMVLLGCAAPLLDFILRLHFISLPISIAPFEAGTAAMLVSLTALVGFVAGWIFGTLWNALHQTS